MEATTTTIVDEVVADGTAVRIAGAPRTGGPRVDVPLPITGESRPVTTGTARDAREAVETTTAAMQAWSSTSRDERAAVLRSVADRLEELASGPWATLLTEETGKRLPESKGEIAFSATYFRTFADLLLAQEDQREQRVPGIAHQVSPQPRGLAVALTPWNFPVSIPARKIAPALAAGCGVLFKPSEIATYSSMVLAAVLDECLPAGLVATVLGEPADVVDTWLDSREVATVSFTGSTWVGRLVSRAAAERLLPTVLELGGCAPFVVLPDADPAKAVDALMIAKFRNNGQSCIAANQIFVAREVAPAVIDQLVQRVSEMRVGDPRDAATDLGPLAPAGDPARMRALVDEAVAGGARCLTGGGDLPEEGHFAPPVVLVGVPTESRAFREEIFGPVAAVHVYDDLDDALALHRATSYGLAGYVCGTDVEAATQVGRRLRAGIVGINNGTPNHPTVPFGGQGLSGLGYEGGRQGLEAFQAFQTVAVAEG